MALITMEMLQEAGFKPESLDGDSKLFLEVFNAFEEAKTHEEYVAVKQKYAADIPKITKMINEKHLGKEISPSLDFLVSKCNFTYKLTDLDGELYFDRLQEAIFEEVRKSPEYVKPRNFETYNALNPEKTVPVELVAALQSFVDRVNADNAPYVADFDNNEPMLSHRIDSNNLGGNLTAAIQAGDEAKCAEIYEKIAKLEEDFKSIPGVEKCVHPVPNIAPSRSMFFPLEFKDNYYFSAMIRSASFIKTFTELTGMNLNDVAARPNYLNDELIEKSMAFAADKSTKQNATEAEFFDMVTSQDQIGSNLVMASGAMVSIIAMPLRMVTNLTPEVATPQNVAKCDALFELAGAKLMDRTADIQKMTPAMRIENMLQAKEPYKSIAVTIGLKAPEALPTAAELKKNAAGITDRINASSMSPKEKAAALAGVKKGVARAQAAIKAQTAADKLKRKEAIAEGKARAKEKKEAFKGYDADQAANKKGCDKLYKAFMAELKKTNPEEYKKRVALDKVEAAENKALTKAVKAEQKAQLKLEEYFAMRKAGVKLTPKEEAKEAKLNKEWKEKDRALDTLLDAAEKASDRRFKRGECTQVHHDVRASQLGSGDYSYHVMNSLREQSIQPSTGAKTRLGITPETIAAELAAKAKAAPVPKTAPAKEKVSLGISKEPKGISPDPAKNAAALAVKKSLDK